MSAQNLTVKFFSSDSHVCEPPELWTSRLKGVLKDRAPRIIRNLNGRLGDFFVCEDVNPRSVFAAFAAGVPSDQLQKRGELGFDTAPPSIRNPAARIQEQDVDGVSGEVLYPTMADMIYGCKDSHLRHACFTAYNDFIAEYCSHDPQRLVGIGMLDLEDVGWAIRELKRCAEIKLRAVLLRADPASGEYGTSELDPLWAAALEANLPIAIHRGAIRSDITQDMFKSLTNYVLIPAQIQRLLSTMLLGGVWERFPELKLICGEFDITWLPHFIDRIDHAYSRFGRAFGLDYSRLPSEQMRQSVFFTFQNEIDDLPYIKERMGGDNLLWASDYPHADSTWPNSRQVVEQVRKKVLPDTASRYLHRNCEALFGLHPIADSSN